MSELTREQVLTAIIAGRGPAFLRGVDLSNLDLSSAGWLVEADLRGANLSHARLSNANLKGSILAKANLHSANLTGANLDGADLKEARLTTANLRKANLRGANLQAARLVGADLSKANLEGANLEGADLEGANLQGADLWNANVSRANFKQANLTGTSIQATSLRQMLPEGALQASGEVLPSQGFSGSMNCVQLTDLIQLVCLSRATLLIRVESSDGQGTIHIRSGKVHHAEAGKLEGEEAFFQMLQWENGHFETMPIREVGRSSIDKPIEHLLIESMRQKDEKGKSARR